MSAVDRRAFASLLVLALTAAAAAQEASPPAEVVNGAAEPVAGSEASAAAPDDPADDAQAGSPAPAGAASFRFEIEDESGGGEVQGWAGAMQGVLGEEQRHVLTGGFEIRFRDYLASGDRAVYDRANERFQAEGSVVLVRGDEVLRGSRLEVNLADETASVFEVEGALGSDYFFRGAAIHKLGEDRYTILDGEFSACEAPADGGAPDWSFRARRVDVNARGYARTRGVSFRARRAPLLYLPYMLWPVRGSRVSGFLTPKPGFSTRRGPSLGVAYFWAINRSYDATFQADLFAGAPESASADGVFSTEPFWGLGTEFRYRPSEGTEGIFDGYLIEDTERGERRWRMRWNHESERLPGGFRGVVRFEDVSDLDFFRDFERRVDRNTLRQLYSTAFFTRNWGAQSLNVQLDSRRTFLSADSEIELRQLPEVEYKLRSTRLGRAPVYFKLRSSMHYLDLDRSETRRGRYGRADLEPELSIPVPLAPWLSLSVTAGGRWTWYGDSLLSFAERRAAMSESDFRGKDLVRLAPTAAAEIVGPGVSRIFELDEDGRFSRLKHVVEPRIVYGYFDDFDERFRIPLFDEIDSLRGRNIARFSLHNRLLARPADPDEGGAFELLSLEIFRELSLDRDKPLLESSDRSLASQNGPVGALLRFNPSRRTGVRFDALYDTLHSQVSSTAVSGSLGVGSGGSLGLRWAMRRNPELDTTRRHHAQVSAGLDLIPDRLRVNSMVSYDVQQQLVQIQRHVVDFKACCYGLQLEIADFRTAQRSDTRYRLLVTLKSVGAFFDITGGRTESL